MTEHAYTTVALVRGIHRIEDAPDSRYEEAIATATGQIDEFCGRRFDMVTSVSREFDVELDYLSGHFASMTIDDIPVGGPTVSRVELSTDPSDDDSWVVQESGWWLSSGVPGARTPKEGWPYAELTVARTYGWEGRYVRITADWGWDAVPKQVERACLMSAARIVNREDSVMGILSSGDFGTVGVFPRPDPDTARMLRPFKRDYLLSRWD